MDKAHAVVLITFSIQTCVWPDCWYRLISHWDLRQLMHTGTLIQETN